MRMWMISPAYMCAKHRCGEHGEIHKHRHNFVKKHSISGRVAPVVQVQPEAMQVRHDELAATLKGHKSPYEMPDISYLPSDHRHAVVNQEISIKDLSQRCPDCRKIMRELGVRV